MKGQGSVLEGITRMQGLIERGRHTMDPSCEDLAWEMENYTWKLDKNDEPTDDPVKENDDACDADRYGVMAILGRQSTFRVRSA